MGWDSIGMTSRHTYPVFGLMGVTGGLSNTQCIGTVRENLMKLQWQMTGIATLGGAVVMSRKLGGQHLLISSIKIGVEN